MDRIARCEYCNKEFKEKDSNEYVRKCVLHEISHTHIKQDFEENLKSALKTLDQKYTTESNYENYNINVASTSCDSNDVNYIVYNFTLIINKDIYKDIAIWGQHKEFKHCPTILQIIDEIEKYYKFNVENTYEGRVILQDWLTSCISDDYVLNGQCIKDICKELLGKKIKITVLDD